MYLGHCLCNYVTERFRMYIYVYMKKNYELWKYAANIGAEK